MRKRIGLGRLVPRLKSATQGIVNRWGIRSMRAGRLSTDKWATGSRAERMSQPWRANSCILRER
jgi:hypothetical protein